MFKIKVYASSIFIIFSIFVSACIAHSQQQPSQKVRSERENTTTTSKKELAKQVLSEAGIAQKYDLYLNNSVDITISPSTSNDQFRVWLVGILAKEAGWQKIENQYITSLEANFSEAELKELLKIAKKPLMKKLLQAEIQSYVNASQQRRKLLDKVWDDYNSGKIIPPQNIVPK
ncbi:DUF2059 domain-containing protein [Aliinostoc sp. HNIBRCY26]|uniref:DUF2059 domain-containing protein n=1 Tax=Aliinostoc sp. HNIBRCY26 TaxID=3418997 RepID=UPI003D05DE7E